RRLEAPGGPVRADRDPGAPRSRAVDRVGTHRVDDVDAALALAFREERGRVVASLIRATGDWTVAEECAQEAFAVAARRRADDGVPARRGAWLTTVARNRARDRLRRQQAEERALRASARSLIEPDDAREDEVEDDRLRLIFTCAHPALALDVRVALTLRTLC